MDEKKKITAAVSAVVAYIRMEEEAVCMQAAMQSAGPAMQTPPSPPAPLNLWGVSGRQAQMQMRSMMQLKAFHGFKFYK